MKLVSECKCVCAYFWMFLVSACSFSACSFEMVCAETKIPTNWGSCAENMADKRTRKIARGKNTGGNLHAKTESHRNFSHVWYNPTCLTALVLTFTKYWDHLCYKNLVRIWINTIRLSESLHTSFFLQITFLNLQQTHKKIEEFILPKFKFPRLGLKVYDKQIQINLYTFEA